MSYIKVGWSGSARTFKEILNLPWGLEKLAELNRDKQWLFSDQCEKDMGITDHDCHLSAEDGCEGCEYQGEDRRGKEFDPTELID